MSDNHGEERLSRIEDKIDKLSEAMIDLARAEEKLIGIEKSNQMMFERMNKYGDRLDLIEKTVYDNAQTVKTINKIFYLIITGLATVAFKVFFGV